MSPAWHENHLRLGIIDLGTNSVRFDAWVARSRGKAELLHREKRPVRLGKGLYHSGKLEGPAMARALSALADFARMARDWGLDHTGAYATAAVRDARNGPAFLKAVARETGLNFHLVSGLEEAELTALGVLENQKLPGGTFALVDIGGGSTELSLCRGKTVLKKASLALGALRLQDRVLRRQPPSAAQLQALRREIHALAGRRLKGWKAPILLGSSGTAKTLARMASHAGHACGPLFLSHLNARMATLNKAGLLDLPGMEAKRVDLILAGSILMEELAFLLGAKKIKATKYALRDGLLIRELGKLKF